MGRKDRGEGKAKAELMRRPNGLWSFLPWYHRGFGYDLYEAASRLIPLPSHAPPSRAKPPERALPPSRATPPPRARPPPRAHPESPLYSILHRIMGRPVEPPKRPGPRADERRGGG